ncbi:MAG TPA: hypothetical protein ENN87_11110 [Phycisphaerales bacterium]|nr:hypothetical protein [Phycisphaerales bacterium]
MVSWKQKVGLGPIELIGLDIGTAWVKLVQLRRDNNGYVGTKIAVEPIEADGSDEPPAEVRVARAVRQCLKQAGVNAHAVCAVCGPEVMVRTFRFPHLPAEALGQAVLLEAQQVCPLDITTSVVDYRLVQPPDPSAKEDDAASEGPASKQGVLVVAPNETIQRQVQQARAGSAKVALVDVEGLALLNCVSAFEHREHHTSIAVVNVGKTYTNVAVLGSDGLPFIRDLPTAANDIIASIAQTTGNDPNTVEQAVADPEKATTLGLDMPAALRESCRGLVTSISETLRYYGLQEGADPIRRILLCGGFALVGEFVQMLDHALTEEVVVFNPFAEIPWVGDRTGLEWAQRVGPVLAVATGLAMRTT